MCINEKLERTLCSKAATPRGRRPPPARSVACSSCNDWVEPSTIFSFFSYHNNSLGAATGILPALKEGALSEPHFSHLYIHRSPTHTRRPQSSSTAPSTIRCLPLLTLITTRWVTVAPQSSSTAPWRTLPSLSTLN